MAGEFRARRIVIVGNAGSGKSTFARRLGELLKIPVFHLDALNWGPNWQRIPLETLRSLIAGVTSQEAWITDGNYALATFDLRLPRADLLIWVERPAWQCALRVIRRAALGRFRAAERLSAGCTERFDLKFMRRLQFIANFNRLNRPKIEAARVRYGPDVPVVVLRGDDAISEFLEQFGG